METKVRVIIEGCPISPGDKILDFRDTTWTFISTIENDRKLYVESNGIRRIFFPSVFKAIIVPAIMVEDGN